VAAQPRAPQPKSPRVQPAASLIGFSQVTAVHAQTTFWPPVVNAMIDSARQDAPAWMQTVTQ
jgi:hypothetical protein